MLAFLFILNSFSVFYRSYQWPWRTTWISKWPQSMPVKWMKMVHPSQISLRRLPLYQTLWLTLTSIQPCKAYFTISLAAFNALVCISCSNVILCFIWFFNRDTSKSPFYWSRVILRNIARLAKEATTIRRVLEPLFHNFDAENHWSQEKGVAFSILMYLQLLMEETGYFGSFNMHPS